MRGRMGLPGMGGDRKRDPQFQKYIRALSVAFLEDTLNHDAKAKLGETGVYNVEKSGGLRSDY